MFETLFDVKNSLGQSFVRYALKEKTNGAAKVKCFWINGRNGEFKRKLNLLEENFAYGCKQHYEGNKIELQIVSIPQRTITIERNEIEWKAFCKIKEQEARLEEINVEVKRRFGLQHVSRVEIRGECLESLDKIIEVITF